MAGSQTVIEIRQLFQLAEFEEVLRLQQAIWGFPDIELLPLRFLVVVSKVGGHVFGAYDGPIDVKPGETTRDGKITVEFAECIGVCEGAPAVLIDDVGRLNVTPDKVDDLIAELRAR